MSKRPFKQTKEDNIIIRKFSNKVKGHELKWHYDLKHRIEKNSIIEIPPYVYHRVIKGDGDLIVSIKES
jgi:hypothetical protein